MPPLGQGGELLADGAVGDGERPERLAQQIDVAEHRRPLDDMLAQRGFEAGEAGLLAHRRRVVGVVALERPHGQEAADREDRAARETRRLLAENGQIVLEDRAPSAVQVDLGECQDDGVDALGSPAEELELGRAELGAGLDDEQQRVGALQ